MATRRKYKVQHFRDGGRVLQDVPIEGDAPAEAGGFPSEILGLESAGDEPKLGVSHTPSFPEQPPAADKNPLQRALDAQRRADELQRERQAPQPPPTSEIDRHIEKIPNLSEHKKQLLRAFPIILQDAAVGASFNRHYQAGLQSGLADDTPELDNYLIGNVAREIEHRRQLALAQESEDVAVQRLEDEAAAIMRSEAPPAPIASAPSQRAPPSIQGRRVPMSAPVSRDVHMTSGQRQSDSNSMTLTAEERDIAHRSYSAPDMTDAQKEYEYAKAKRRMIQMKADGSIQGDR